MDDMIKLTGLWKNTSKDGKEYFAGSLGGARVLIFSNSYKEADKHPDFNLYLAPKKRDEDRQDEKEMPF